MTYNILQNQARELLKEDKIEETLEILDNYLKENAILDKSFSDTLVSLSASHRDVVKLDRRNVIDYESYRREKARILSSLLSLVNDLPSLKPKKNNQIVPLESSLALAYIENIQGNQFGQIREQLLSTDNLIVKLAVELRQRETEIFEIREQGKVELYLQKIEFLKERIQEEEKKYKELKEQYESLKREQSKVAELNTEIKHVKEQSETRREHIKILEDRFVWNEKQVQAKEEQIEKLQNLIKNKKSETFKIVIGIVIFFLLVIIALIYK